MNTTNSVLMTAERPGPEVESLDSFTHPHTEKNVFAWVRGSHRRRSDVPADPGRLGD